MVQRLGQEKRRMSLEHLVVGRKHYECKYEMDGWTDGHTHTQFMGLCQRGIGPK